MSKEKNNLMELWNSVCETDPDMTDRVNFGAFKFTTVDAQYQVQRATEVFGPCGIGWGIRNGKFEMLVVDPADAHFNLMCYTAEVWYKFKDKEGAFEIAADIELFENTKNGWKRVSDPMKKVRTDALTKGLSWIGFSADVFLGRFDNQKYVESLHVKKAQEQKFKDSGVEPPTESQLDEIKSLALSIALSGDHFTNYLKKEFNTSWSRIHGKLANQIILDLRNKQPTQESKPVEQTISEADEKIQFQPEEKKETKKKVKLPPKTADDYFTDLTDEEIDKANSDKDLEKKILLNQTARSLMNELYAAAPDKDHILQAISKACQDITGPKTLANDALALTKISVRKLETLVKTLKNLGV